MRIGILGLHHETNTFAPRLADLAAFEAAGIHEGEMIVERYADSEATIGGFLQACSDGGATAVPLVDTSLNPCGLITADAFERIWQRMEQALGRAGPFDAVLLAQHGAAVAEGHDDLDGELAARVRAVVGQRAVIGIGLDLHGNVSSSLCRAADVMVGYRENPHRDSRQRAWECARLVIETVRGAIKPRCSLVRLPMVVPILGGWTARAPMVDLVAELELLAVSRPLLSMTLFHGFPYADVAGMGSAVLAVTDGAPGAGRAAAIRLGTELWRRRDELTGTASSPAEAVDQANSRATASGRPVVLLDVGDNVGGGAPGDSTKLLEHALARGVRGFVAPMCDPHAVASVGPAAIGDQVSLQLGRTAGTGDRRLVLDATVTRVTDGRYEDHGRIHGGQRYFDGGPTVRLTTTVDQEVVVSSQPVQSTSLEQLRAVGIEPAERRVLVAKGVVAPRAAYEAITEEFVLADTPGVTCADPRRLGHRRRPRPLWPFEDNFLRPMEVTPARAPQRTA